MDQLIWQFSILKNQKIIFSKFTSRIRCCSSCSCSCRSCSCCGSDCCRDSCTCRGCFDSSPYHCFNSWPRLWCNNSKTIQIHKLFFSFDIVTIVKISLSWIDTLFSIKLPFVGFGATICERSFAFRYRFSWPFLSCLLLLSFLVFLVFFITISLPFLLWFPNPSSPPSNNDPFPYYDGSATAAWTRHCICWFWIWIWPRTDRIRRTNRVCIASSKGISFNFWILGDINLCS